jgi:Tfp pilus assembly protein PilV
MIAITILVGALLGFSQAILSSATSASSSHQVMIATEAARDMLERLQTKDEDSFPFEELFAAFNSDPADDPGRT